MKQFLIIVSLFLLGCSDSVKTGLLEVSVIDVAECPVKNPFLKDSVPHKWRFVKLETSDSCLIGQIKKVAICKDLIFIQDDQHVFVFDSAGVFRNRIGQKGRGPKEQLSIDAFYVDKEREFVGIYDALLHKIFRYAFDGDLIEKVDCDKELDFIADLCKADDKHVVVQFRNANDYPNEYAVFKERNYAFRSYALPFRVMSEIASDVARPSFGKNDATLMVTAVLSDTLCAFSQGKLVPSLLVKTGKKTIPQKLIDNGGPYTCYQKVVDKAQREGYSSGIERVWLTEKFGCVEYHIYRGTGSFYMNNQLHEMIFHAVNYLIWDLKTHRAIHYSPAGTWGINLFYPGQKNFCTATENELVSCIPAYEIAGIDRAKMDGDPIYSDSRIREIVDSTEENDNPVIVYYPLDSI